MFSGEPSFRALWLAACLLALHATGASQAFADPLGEARERVLKGEGLFERGDYRAALTEYERAYELVAGHPLQHRALFNIAKCYERLFDYPTALAYYERYLREGGPNAERRVEVERLLASLRTQLAILRLSANVRAEIWIDERQVGATPADVPVSGGRHTIAVRARGHEPYVFETQLAAGQTHSRHVELTPLSDLAGAPPVWFWTSIGLTGAALVTSAALGITAAHASDELSDQLEDPVEKLRADPAQRGRIDDLALAADVALGATVLFGATSLVLYFVTDWNDGASHERAAARGVRATPMVGPTAVGLTLGGEL